MFIIAWKFSLFALNGIITNRNEWRMSSKIFWSQATTTITAKIFQTKRGQFGTSLFQHYFVSIHLPLASCILTFAWAQHSNDGIKIKKKRNKSHMEVLLMWLLARCAALTTARFNHFGLMQKRWVDFHSPAHIRGYCTSTTHTHNQYFRSYLIIIICSFFFLFVSSSSTEHVTLMGSAYIYLYYVFANRFPAFSYYRWIMIL